VITTTPYGMISSPHLNIWIDIYTLVWARYKQI
jgi:hypothetical protein